jgi:hypothetical protein
VEHPKGIGDRSTLAIIAVVRELGFGVYLPFGENTGAFSWSNNPTTARRTYAADYEVGRIAIEGLRVSSGA